MSMRCVVIVVEGVSVDVEYCGLKVMTGVLSGDFALRGIGGRSEMRMGIGLCMRGWVLVLEDYWG